MRRIIVFLIFLVLLFLVNVIFYFISEDYQFFLKKIKNDEEIIYIDNWILHDTIPEEFSEDNIAVIEYNSQLNIKTENNEIDFISEKSEEILWKNYQKILDIFTEYWLETIELTNNLFDLTEEYPENYYEYYSKDLTLYFFNTKTYSEVYDIFDVLAYDLPFTLNKVDNFWNASFYINLNEDIKDNYIRMVVNYKWVVFGLKIKNSEYNVIKGYLWELET